MFSNHCKPQRINLCLSSFFTSPLLRYTLFFPSLPLLTDYTLYFYFHPFLLHPLFPLLFCSSSNIQCYFFNSFISRRPLLSLISHQRCSWDVSINIYRWGPLFLPLHSFFTPQYSLLSSCLTLSNFSIHSNQFLKRHVLHERIRHRRLRKRAGVGGEHLQD